MQTYATPPCPEAQLSASRLPARAGSGQREYSLKIAESDFRLPVPLCSGATKPCNCSCSVFLDTGTVGIARADGELSFDVAFESSYESVLKVGARVCSEPEDQMWDSDKSWVHEKS